MYVIYVQHAVHVSLCLRAHACKRRLKWAKYTVYVHIDIDVCMHKTDRQMDRQMHWHLPVHICAYIDVEINKYGCINIHIYTYHNMYTHVYACTHTCAYLGQHVTNPFMTLMSLCVWGLRSPRSSMLLNSRTPVHNSQHEPTNAECPPRLPN